MASSKNKAARASTVYDAIENQTINNIDDSDGLAPMHRLCAGSSNNCAELIMQLANAGADLNVLDSEGIHHCFCVFRRERPSCGNVAEL